MNWLLDTDTCVFFLRGDEKIHARITEIGRETIAISVVSLVELRYGAEYSAETMKNHQVVDQFVGGLAVLGIDDRVARAFAKIKTDLRRAGTLIPDFDLLIAATAAANNLTLVTNNTAHFDRISNLRLANWLSP